MDACEKILLIRLKAIGDVVLTLPAVNTIRENFPTSKITFLTSKENVSLLQGFQEVNEVIALDRGALRGSNPIQMLLEFYRLLRRLRSGEFDAVVDFHGNGETAWLTRITGATHRWREAFGGAHGWAYTQQIQPGLQFGPLVHGAQWHLYLLEHCGLKVGEARNDFVLPESAIKDARTWFAVHQLDLTKPTIYFQPFTSSPQKDWPLENYLALARHWKSRGWQIIFGGGPADRAKLRPSLGAGFAVSAGVPLLVTGGLMKFSRIVVGGDTGALHLAVALGKRVVMLMNPGPFPFGHPEWAVVPELESPLSAVTLEKMIETTEAAMADVHR